MNMAIYIVLLLCLGVAAQQVVCYRYIILPSPDSPCPGESNRVACSTLQRLARTDLYRSRVGDDLTLELQSGIHVRESTFHIDGIHSVEIIGHNATFLCNRSRYPNFSFVSFQSIENFSIRDITFIDCGQIDVSHVRNATFSGDTLTQTSSIRFYYSTTAVISNCTFRDNGDSIRYYGSAVTMSQANSVLITQSTFINNTAVASSSLHRSNDGAAIHMNPDQYSRSGSSLTIDRCIFMNNTGYQGGAVYIYIKSPTVISSRQIHCTIYRSVFINNTAIFRGGAISADGNVSIVDSIFAYNMAPRCAVLGTGFNWLQLQFRVNFQSSIFLYNRAINVSAQDNQPIIMGGVACISNTALTINNCTFSYNMAKGSGGVLNAENSSIALNSSSFHYNAAEIDGGVLYTHVLPSTIVITECSLTNNKAGDDGGAIYIETLYRTRSTIDISRSSFSNNIANDRGGAIMLSRSTLEVVTTNMQNNRANSGDDIAVCTYSSAWSPSRLFTHFQLQNSSIECAFYGELTVIFSVPAPEDHSNTSLANYLHVPPGAINPHSGNDRITSTVMSEIPRKLFTTTEEAQLLSYIDLQDELSKTSAALYALLSFSLLLIIILMIVVIALAMLYLKKKATKAETLSSNDINKSSTINKHSESVQLYEEPVWRNDQLADAIKMEPNIGYAKSMISRK